MSRFQEHKASLILLVLGIFAFIPFLGGAHLFDWDEINFAESAREMIVSGNYLTVQINFLPFWEKPPLFIWMQVLSMNIFGINEFAARLPNALCGIVTLLVLFHTGRRFRDEKFGWIWVGTYAGSLLPFFYFKFGIIDPWFNLFIFLGIAHFVCYLATGQFRTRNLVLSALFLGLAVLTKGPVALLIFLLVLFVYLLSVRFKMDTSVKDVCLFAFVIAVTGGLWFILQIFSGNMAVVRDFIVYQIRLFRTKDAGHGGFLLYHVVVLFLGVFPASVFALSSFFKRETDKAGDSRFNLWMQTLFFVVLVLFTIVKTKIVHYSSLCYFPLTFVASLTIWKIAAGEMLVGRTLRWLLGTTTALLGLVVALVALVDTLKEKIIGYGWIRNAFAAGALQASGNWAGYEPSIGILFIVVSGWFVWNLSKTPCRSVKGIFAASFVFAYLVMTLFTPRIEAYSQRAAVEFYRSVAREDAYITTVGFASYAHLFYGEIKPPANQSAYDKAWLLAGKIDKRTYVVFKNSRKERYLREYPDLQLLYEKNGFVFAKREPR